MRKFYALTILTLIVLVSCVGPRKLTKRGDKLAEAGIHQEAVEFYVQALDKNRAHVDAQVGLRKSAGEVINNYQSKFFTAYASGDNKTAVYTYLELESFVKRMNNYNLNITIPSQYTNDFKEAKDNYVNVRFEEANNLLSASNFKASEIIFDEIKKIAPDYNEDDLNRLREISKLEPHYRAGNDALANEKPRTAYYSFEKIVSVNPNYKDSKFKMEDALNEAQYPIAILKFKNYSGKYGLDQKVQAEFISALIQNKGPFIKVIDRTTTDDVIKEQYMSMDGWVQGTSAVKTGELIGAKAILSGKLLSVKTIKNAPKSTVRKAYKEVKRKVYDPVQKNYNTVTEYEKVNYLEYNGSNEVIISFQYMLVSSETGEVLISEIIEKKEVSTVNYSEYNGNVKDLVPGNWLYIARTSPEDKMNLSRSARTQLHNQFNSNKVVEEPINLQSKALAEAGKEAAYKITQFNPEN